MDLLGIVNSRQHLLARIIDAFASEKEASPVGRLSQRLIRLRRKWACSPRYARKDYLIVYEPKPLRFKASTNSRTSWERSRSPTSKASGVSTMTASSIPKRTTNRSGAWIRQF